MKLAIVRCRRLSAPAAALAGALLAAHPVAAEGPPLSSATRAALGQEIALTYSVTGIGLPILSAEFSISLARDRYRATSVVRTEGIAGLMMQSRWDTRTEGSVTASGLRPAKFRADIATSRGRGAVSVTWDGGRQKISAVPENRPERTAELDRYLAPDLPDPLTAMITAALASAGTPCTGVQRAFDGRRIFDLAFSFDRPVIVKGAPHFNGYAYRCAVKYMPVAGHTPDELDQERRAPSAGHPMWLTPVSLGASAATVLIPVRIDLATGWGTTTVFLTRATMDGRPITPARTASSLAD